MYNAGWWVRVIGGVGIYFCLQVDKMGWVDGVLQYDTNLTRVLENNRTGAAVLWNKYLKGHTKGYRKIKTEGGHRSFAVALLKIGPPTPLAEYDDTDATNRIERLRQQFPT